MPLRSIRQLTWSRKEVRRLYTSFSNKMLKIGNSEIGRYLLLSIFDPDLNTGMTLATLNFDGATPNWNEKLKIVSKGFAIANFRILIIAA